MELGRPVAGPASAGPWGSGCGRLDRTRQRCGQRALRDLALVVLLARRSRGTARRRCQACRRDAEEVTGGGARGDWAELIVGAERKQIRRRVEARAAGSMQRDLALWPLLEMTRKPSPAWSRGSRFDGGDRACREVQRPGERLRAGQSLAARSYESAVGVHGGRCCGEAPCLGWPWWSNVAASYRERWRY